MRRPVVARSGFYADAAGRVVTTRFTDGLCVIGLVDPVEGADGGFREVPTDVTGVFDLRAVGEHHATCRATFADRPADVVTIANDHAGVALWPHLRGSWEWDVVLRQNGMDRTYEVARLVGDEVTPGVVMGSGSTPVSGATVRLPRRTSLDRRIS